MAFKENQLEFNQHVLGWSPQQHHTDGNNQKKIPDCINYDSDNTSTNYELRGPIFMTNSSKPLDINDVKMSQIFTEKSSIQGQTIANGLNEDSKYSTDLTECPICCNGFSANEIKQMPCCLISICSQCLLTHTITNIRNGKAKIECPACTQDINSSTILYNTEIPVTVRERYQEILAQDLSTQQNTHIKLCPHCNFITILDENHPEIKRARSHQALNEWICCEQCKKEWCWPCYAPAHPDITCKQFKKSHIALDMWAKIRRSDNHQRNAQRCPRCSIYIEKIDGCDHMVCTKCNSKFCYRCGGRMILPNSIGHDAKYSIFGCKYKLYPDRPLLRWLIRGSILAGIILLVPIILALIIALIAVGIPILLIVVIFGLPIVACVRCKKR